MAPDTRLLLEALAATLPTVPRALLRQAWTHVQLCHLDLDATEATALMLAAGLGLDTPAPEALERVRALLAPVTVPCPAPTVEIPPPNPTRDVADHLVRILADLRNLEVIAEGECSVPVAHMIGRLAGLAAATHREVDRAATHLEQHQVQAANGEAA